LKVESIGDPVRLEMLKSKLADPKQAEEMLQEIRKNYSHYKLEICEFIESFRKSGQFKF
jgi:chromosome segregation and condensation protein ScpB